MNKNVRAELIVTIKIINSRLVASYDVFKKKGGEVTKIGEELLAPLQKNRRYNIGETLEGYAPVPNLLVQLSDMNSNNTLVYKDKESYENNIDLASVSNNSEFDTSAPPP